MFQIRLIRENNKIKRRGGVRNERSTGVRRGVRGISPPSLVDTPGKVFPVSSRPLFRGPLSSALPVPGLRGHLRKGSLVSVRIKDTDPESGYRDKIVFFFFLSFSFSHFFVFDFLCHLLRREGKTKLNSMGGRDSLLSKTIFNCIVNVEESVSVLYLCICVRHSQENYHHTQITK